MSIKLLKSFLRRQLEMLMNITVHGKVSTVTTKTL